ncbi:hypothetical protein FK178_10940 [Antarcticibacterium arcticum]|uniref:Uncharacterized protein n=1 Tax=Antarcticibacterium arcticum TaxID=2585771 RepID=A0A5B8YJQ3_9FLAO|nr:hypothetical protein [Antarcticibacterium arcticum]QED38200.1 hypothetical protein FK178_10940 [Antarcticibacterium arcticum]
MTRFYKYFEYAYLVMAAFFLFETIRIWNEERNRAYLFIFFVIVAVFMYFFKRRFRKNLENRNR